MMRALTEKGWLDRAAMGLSGLCLVHCATSVLLVAMFATAGGALLNPRIHEVGLLLATMLAAVALGLGVLRHGQIKPAIVGALGVASMAAGLFQQHGAGEAIFTMIGVTVVALGHQLNRRARPETRD